MKFTQNDDLWRSKQFREAFELNRAYGLSQVDIRVCQIHNCIFQSGLIFVNWIKTFY